MRGQGPGYSGAVAARPAPGDLTRDLPRLGASKERRSMSRLIMLPCAAFLRVYEPLSAFGPAERSRWEAYAAAENRPRRAEALEAERIDALRRIIALPPIVVPAQESPHGYVRWADGITYVCPWQTRLRSRLALARLRETAGPLLADAFAPGQAQLAAEDSAEGKGVPPGSTSRAVPGRCRWRGSFRSPRPSAGWCSARRPRRPARARRRPHRLLARSSTRRPWLRRVGGSRERSQRCGAGRHRDRLNALKTLVRAVVLRARPR